MPRNAHPARKRTRREASEGTAFLRDYIDPNKSGDLSVRDYATFRGINDHTAAGWARKKEGQAYLGLEPEEQHKLEARLQENKSQSYRHREPRTAVSTAAAQAPTPDPMSHFTGAPEGVPSTEWLAPTGETFEYPYGTYVAAQYQPGAPGSSTMANAAGGLELTGRALDWTQTGLPPLPTGREPHPDPVYGNHYNRHRGSGHNTGTGHGR